MKNQDMPAMPQHGVQDENGTLVSIGEWSGEVGLTKLEHFAALAPAMPSWFSESYVRGPSNGNKYTEGQKKAFMAWPVYYAKAILENLEEANG